MFLCIILVNKNDGSVRLDLFVEYHELADEKRETFSVLYYWLEWDLEV